MALPAGTKYYVPVTVDRTKVGETASNFLYQIDLSAKLAADAVFKSHITTAANIAVYSVATGLKVPRKVVLDLASNYLLVYWDGTASTSVDLVFYVCVGSAVNEIDSTATFTNSGVVNLWGFNAASGTSAEDYAGGYTATVQSPSDLGRTGQFGRAYYCPSDSGAGRADISGNLNLVGDITVSVIINAKEVNNVYGRIISNGDFNLQTNVTAQSFALKSNSSATPVLSGPIPKLEWLLLTVTRTSSGVTNFYYNTALSGAANQSSGTPAAGSSQYYIGNTPAFNRSFSGYIDSFSISRDIKTIGHITSRYNMLFAPATFFAIGSGVKTAFPPIVLWNKVKQRLRAGFK